MIPSTGDVDYATWGVGYAGRRQTDPRIAALVDVALGTARTVLNVGAGAGSYEPVDRTVVAVEPSEAMLAQRPPGTGPVIRAVAQALPLGRGAVDAAMAMVSIHQWPDPLLGIAELCRVSRGPVVILTFDPDALDRLWLMEYAPELLAAETARFPTVRAIASALGPTACVHEVPVPFDCVDGFTEAYYGRPEAFLDPSVRRSQSLWSFLEPAVEEMVIGALAGDLASGRWDERHGALRSRPSFLGALRLVVRP
ncbi:MAG TPA: methyltransferase domain-containing protein [Acidimicrobiales bacterium]